MKNKFGKFTHFCKL